MASQISHIVYADKFFEKMDEGKFSNAGLLGKINREEFILGAIFPDIRLIDDRVSRKDTHMYFPKIDLNFSGLTSFESGWKFHLYCDMKREELLNQYDFYSLRDTREFSGRPARSLEDELIYDEYGNWEKINHYFNHPPYIETKIGTDEETYMLWYAIIAKYISVKPNDKSISNLISKWPSMAKNVSEIIDKVKKLRNDKRVVEILLQVKDKIV